MCTEYVHTISFQSKLFLAPPCTGQKEHMKSLRPTAEVPKWSVDLGKGTCLKFGDEPYQPYYVLPTHG